MKKSAKWGDPDVHVNSTNVIKEYYKLKQRLCLTDEERKVLKINKWGAYDEYKSNQ